MSYPAAGEAGAGSCARAATGAPRHRAAKSASHLDIISLLWMGVKTVENSSIVRKVAPSADLEQNVPEHALVIGFRVEAQPGGVLQGPQHLMGGRRRIGCHR